MSVTDLVFAVLAAGALTLALRAVVRMIGAAGGSDCEDKGAG
jgi:hypothetical protein